MLPSAYDTTRGRQKTYAKCGNKSEYFIVPLWPHSIFAIKYEAKIVENSPRVLKKHAACMNK